MKLNINRTTVGLSILWLILVVLIVWRITSAERWGYAIAIALIAWLGGLVTAILGQLFLVRNQDNW